MFFGAINYFLNENARASAATGRNLLPVDLELHVLTAPSLARTS